MLYFYDGIGNKQQRLAMPTFEWPAWNVYPNINTNLSELTHNFFTWKAPYTWGFFLHTQVLSPCASCQIPKIAYCAWTGMPGTFSPPPWVSDPDMHHGTCVMHVPWCMPGSLTSGFHWSRCRGKRSQHSRRMRNLTYLVRGPRYNTYFRGVPWYIITHALDTNFWCLRSHLWLLWENFCAANK